MLRYKAESTLRAGRIGVVILFDISSFFDHLDPEVMRHTLTRLGFPLPMVQWVVHLMSAHTLSLSFNNFTSDLISPEFGTPQGSPLSPIISALFTSPLLHQSSTWDKSDLSLYVDDGSIFTSNVTFQSVTDEAVQRFHEVLSWLRDFGLLADMDKTEIMYFRRHCLSPSKFGTQPLTVSISDPFPATLTPSSRLRYLGVFFTPTLDWSAHVKIMATRARSTIRALQIIGNSVRGLQLPCWRKIFLSVIIPVLTYGHQVWFTDVRQKSLIQILQVAQNEGCRKVGGVFKTTPIDLVERLLTIPPIRFRLRHLSCQAGSRLSRLPPSSALRNPLHAQKVIRAPHFLDPLPILPTVCEVPTS